MPILPASPKIELWIWFLVVCAIFPQLSHWALDIYVPGYTIPPMRVNSKCSVQRSNQMLGLRDYLGRCYKFWLNSDYLAIIGCKCCPAIKLDVLLIILFTKFQKHFLLWNAHSIRFKNTALPISYFLWQQGIFIHMTFTAVFLFFFMKYSCISQIQFYYVYIMLTNIHIFACPS